MNVDERELLLEAAQQALQAAYAAIEAVRAGTPNDHRIASDATERGSAPEAAEEEPEYPCATGCDLDNAGAFGNPDRQYCRRHRVFVEGDGRLVPYDGGA